MTSYNTLINDWQDFSQSILDFIDTLGLGQASLVCDHVALRVNSLDLAIRLEEEFGQRGQNISKNMINGRPIVIIALDTPLVLGPYHIDCVELPYPSEKYYPNEGWEHIELVFETQAKSCDELSQALLTEFPQLAPVLAGNTDISVKMSSPKGDNERLPNPTIAFKQGNICIKLHTHTIKAIIASEQGCS